MLNVVMLSVMALSLVQFVKKTINQHIFEFVFIIEVTTEKGLNIDSTASKH